MVGADVMSAPTHSGSEMEVRSKRIGWPTRILTTATIAVGLVAFWMSASAADLGGIRGASVFADSSDVTVSVPPPPGLVNTDFSGCQNTIDGWTDPLGNQWTSHSGKWQCLGSDTVRAQQRRSFAHASVDVGLSDELRITTLVSRVSTQNNRSGPGLGLLSDGSTFIYIVYDGDDEILTFGQVSPGGDIEFENVSISVSAPVVISVAIDRPNIEISINGSQLLDVDLTDHLPSAEIDHLFTHTRFGLVSDNDNFSAFDTFKVETWS